MIPSCEILKGNCLDVLKTLPGESVHCCVTSPPYWGLRDYGVDGQIGLEPTIEAYVAKMVEVFSEVRRVVRGDGTCWVNLGDSYSRAPEKGGSGPGNKGNCCNGLDEARRKMTMSSGTDDGFVGRARQKVGRNGSPEIKPKDLCGIPWRVAFALQADGWWLRQDIIWAKPNPMPESVTDRCTKAHEYLFLLAKSASYFYDAEAIKEPETMKPQRRLTSVLDNADNKVHGRFDYCQVEGSTGGGTRNKRSVWTINTQPYSDAHFATFPPDLVKPCILAGCPVGGTVLDPFGGSGTTGMVANELGRNAILIELNEDYVKLADRRCDVTPGLGL